MDRSPEEAGDPAPFKDAEAWLAARGIEREPVAADVPEPPCDVPARPDAEAPPSQAMGARDAVRLLRQTVADAELREADASSLPSPAAGSLEVDVSEALAYVRRSTAAAPQAEGRVRARLAARGCSAPVIEATLERARRERLVDDAAMAAAIVAERRARGHAPARIARDLRARGFDDEVVAVALGGTAAEDPQAAAFEVASAKAKAVTALAPEVAYRRVVGHVVRRGYPEGLARKVAREAVFTARDQQRTAGR